MPPRHSACVAAALLLFFVPEPLDAQAVFSRGALLVLRVAPGGSDVALSSSAAAIFIDEVSTNGSIIGGPFAVPSAGEGSCVLAGNASTEGQLSISPDGGSAAFACYVAEGGDADVVTAEPAHFRAVVVVGLNGSISAPVILEKGATDPPGTDPPYTSPPRSVYSAIVIDAWTSAARFYVGGRSVEGVKGAAYAYVTSPGVATTATLTYLDSHGVSVWANTLYVAGAVGAPSTSLGVNIVGLAGGPPPVTVAAVTAKTTDSALDQLYSEGAARGCVSNGAIGSLHTPPRPGPAQSTPPPTPLPTLSPSPSRPRRTPSLPRRSGCATRGWRPRRASGASRGTARSSATSRRRRAWPRACGRPRAA